MPDFNDHVFMVYRKARGTSEGMIPHSLYGDNEYAEEYVKNANELYPSEEFALLPYTLPFYPA